MERQSSVEIRIEQIGDLPRYAAVRSNCHVESVFDIAQEAGKLQLRERRLVEPTVKDYDLVEAPLSWPTRFDMSGWRIVAAYVNGARVGGAIGAINCPELQTLAGSRNGVILWDLRVAHEVQRRGVGTALFQAIEAWGREDQRDPLVVETQNTNVVACRFYLRMGCVLEQANEGAYSQFPEEVQLVFSKSLGKSL